ncbi:MAG: DUF1501 domain-containing protein, partial [Planctomycetaceae bacterium]|nr:DUF1501 domain-containing protein [Planctomycetaceae bacterium]
MSFRNSDSDNFRPDNFDSELDVTRRYFLGRCTGVSLGAVGLGLLGGKSLRGNETSPPIGLPEMPHFAPKAKHVIFLTQSGGPSQIELYDDKPGLIEWAGKELPDSVRQGQRLTTMTANQKQLVLPSKAKFKKCGQS